MAYVPHFNQGQAIPTAKPGPPVLINEQVPRINAGVALQSLNDSVRAIERFASGAQQPGMPINAYAGRYQGMNAIGQGLENFSKAAHEIDLEIGRAEASADVNDAIVEMKTAASEFDAWTDENPNPKQWPREWDRRFAGLDKQLRGQKDLSPAAEAEITKRLAMFEVHEADQVRRKTRNATIKRAESSWMARYHVAVKEGKLGEAREILGVMEERSLLFPDQRVLLEIDAEDEILRQTERAEAEAKEVQREEWYGLAKSDPEGFRYMLEDRNEETGEFVLPMESSERERFLSLTRAEEGRLQQQEYEDIIGAIASREITTTEGLYARAERLDNSTLMSIDDTIQRLNHERVRRAMEARKMDLEADAPQNFVALSKEVDAYNREADQSGFEYAALNQKITDILPEGLRGELTQPLHRKRFGGEPDPAQELFARAREAVSIAETAGMFGEVNKTERGFWGGEHVVEEDGKPVLDPVKANSAANRKFTVMMQIRKFIEKNPDATPGEISEKVQEFIQATIEPDREDTAEEKDPVGVMEPGTIEWKTGLEALILN